MSDTDIAYGGVRTAVYASGKPEPACLPTVWCSAQRLSGTGAICLRACYAMPGTDTAHGSPRWRHYRGWML
eukprot:2724881-Rhodomonas_salina.5